MGGAREGEQEGGWVGRGDREGGNGEGEKKGQEEGGDFTYGYDGMPGWTEANSCKQIDCLG